MSRGAASVVCGALALLLTLGGFCLAAAPYVGALLAFAAPVAALFGIVLGGLGIREAQQKGEAQGLATTGLVLSVLGFLTGLLVALTCGLFNACASVALGPAAEEVRKAAEAARRRQAGQRPSPPGFDAGPDLGAPLAELSARCARRELPACASADPTVQFTDLRCEADGSCRLDFAVVEEDGFREGSVELTEQDLWEGPEHYAPLVSDAIEQWRSELDLATSDP